MDHLTATKLPEPVPARAAPTRHCRWFLDLQPGRSVISGQVFFFPVCTCQGVSASAEATYSVLRGRAPGPHRGPWRLPSTGSCQRTSAKTSCSSGASPARLHSPAKRGSSSSDAAMARCAATASRPDQRATQAARAAARSGAGTSRARCPASRRSQVAASAPNRPPTSTPTTTKRQRRARSSSGYV